MYDVDKLDIETLKDMAGGWLVVIETVQSLGYTNGDSGRELVTNFLKDTKDKADKYDAIQKIVRRKRKA